MPKAKPTSAKAPAKELEKYRLTRLVSPFDSAEVVGWHVNDVDKGNGKTFGKGEMTFETRDAAFKMQSLLNAHSELVAALKEMLEYAEKWHGYFEAEFRISSDPPEVEWDAATDRAQAALKKAGAE